MATVTEIDGTNVLPQSAHLESVFVGELLEHLLVIVRARRRRVCWRVKYKKRVEIQFVFTIFAEKTW
jgi:hypothetical protein